jgi:hypothetical protein
MLAIGQALATTAAEKITKDESQRSDQGCLTAFPVPDDELMIHQRPSFGRREKMKITILQSRMSWTEAMVWL